MFFLFYSWKSVENWTSILNENHNYLHSAFPIPAPKTAPKGILQPYASLFDKDAAIPPPINPPKVVLPVHFGAGLYFTYEVCGSVLWW